ncbi:GDSL-like Lipase/Acylhydrolase superfamily protein [Artemisia annua]|uniref:GDSL-like Lipase/Acylhydrolase superfamily protein n=1 Tax=Artemisia annua TaxID=35608 RepID=A0A2U1MGN7_ARTAN|nr:GDSL-like Lipase/Acylhydrolase superfamily protein [Artemisia annua]
MLCTNVNMILFGLLVSLVNLPTDVAAAVIAFGDSNVDNGNNNDIVTMGKANFLPYGKDFEGGKPTGRYTNGKSLSDIMAEKLCSMKYLPAYLNRSIQDEDLLKGVTFASGGSGYDPLTSKPMNVLTLLDQLVLFEEYIGKLERIVGEEAARDIIENAFFIIVSSSNDWAISYIGAPLRSFQYDVPTYAKLLVTLARNFIQDIHKLGAKKILVFSTPPIGSFPLARTMAGGPHRMTVNKYNEAAKSFNSMLKCQLQLLGKSLPESRLYYVDFYYPLLNIIENPQKYGLQVTTRGCCGTGIIELSILCNKFISTCPDRNKFLFWDCVHLTERGYKIFVDQIMPDLLSDIQSRD